MKTLKTLTAAALCAGVVASAGAQTKMLAGDQLVKARPMADYPPTTLSMWGKVDGAIENFDLRGSDPGPITRPNSRCWWDNGAQDMTDGQLSQDLDGFSARVADDFFLKAGNHYYFDDITLTMAIAGDFNEDPEMGDLNPLSVCLELYDDCDGKPGMLLDTFVDPQVMDLGPSATFPGFNLYEFTFDIEQCRDGYQRLWLSPVGKSTGVFYWLTSGGGVVQGVQGQYKSANVGFPNWTDGLDVVNLEYCSDYNFKITGNCCCLLKDNGDFDTMGMSSIFFSSLPWSARAVDNFQVGGEDVRICKLEAYLATNCDPERSVLEIYSNDCDAPDQLLHTLTDPEIIDLMMTDSTGLPIYCFRWIDPDIELTGGQNYWISMVAVGSGNIGERGIWLFKQSGVCTTINITEGQYRNVFAGIDEFTPVSMVTGTARDFAFRLYVTDPLAAPAPPEPGQDNEGNPAGVDELIGVLQGLR